MKIAAADLPRLLGAELAAASELLARCAAPHALIGGLAVGVHTQARATKDIDFAVSADEARAAQIVSAMQAEGFAARGAGAPGPGSVVRFSRTGDDGVERWIDVLFAGTPFEERAIARSSPIEVLGHEVNVVCVEDLLVYKLIAGRPQDVADAVQLLETHGERLDRPYLDASLAEWELQDELRRVEALSR